MTDKRRILILGGGIAGLALGRALLQHGLSAEIVEKASAWDPGGTGIFIPANGFRILHWLGLGEMARQRGRLITQQRYFDHRGHRLLEMGIEDIWGPDGVCVALHRRDLHTVLRESVAGLEVRLGVTVEAMNAGPEFTRVTFSDGSTRTYDLVVGADGIRSSVRRSLFGKSAPRYLGQVSWRLVIDRELPVPSWTVMLGNGRAFLTIPIGGGKLYCYADVSSREPRDPTQGVYARFVELFSDFAEPVPQILRALAPDQARYFSPIEEVTEQQWGRGRAVLIGDAAHATSPNMAEGASMALEDAWVLAELLTSGAPTAECLSRFEARRTPRVRWVREQTHRRDRTRNLPAPLRALVLGRAGKRIFKANHRPLLAAP
jgi:2-polyprenyl-6-methoxyphenol hydroxylase-like FAD-dependent oxidoreductase